jgi:hypothetical protein
VTAIPFLGLRVRFIWPDDGGLSDASGVVVHAAWYEDGIRVGAEVRWDSVHAPDGTRRPLRVPSETHVADVSWLAGPDGQPLQAPPRTERLEVMAVYL